MKKEEIIEILKLMKEILNDNQINKEEVKKKWLRGIIFSWLFKIAMMKKIKTSSGIRIILY